jgi:DNA uptake protein ComE-like DNA-binding protein
MGSISEFFAFTSNQLRFLAALSLLAVALGLYLLVQAYAAPPPQAVRLPVFMSSGETRVTGAFVLDPNTAPADSLELLPGIGKTLADRIVEYRQHHRFEREIDVTEVRGIGPKLFEQLRPYLRVAPQ